MKIYWTKKSIPELTHLPKEIRRRNYYSARRKAISHYEHWLGILLFVVISAGLFILFNRLFPGEDSFLRHLIRAVICIPPASLVWNQCTVYAMRKYYRHVLTGNEKALC